MRSKGERRLRVTTWNFSGLCSECKQKEGAEDIVAGQESWEKDDTIG